MIFLVVLEYAVLASTFTLAKLAVSYAQPFFLIGFRMIIAGLLLLSYLFLFKRDRMKIDRADLGTFFKASLFHIYIAFIFEFWALQFLTSAKTTIIYSTTPFFAAMLSFFLLGERLNISKVCALIIGFMGLIPIFIAQGIEERAVGELLHISTPEIALLVSVISASYAWFIIKKLMHKNYSLVLINGFAMLVGGVLSMSTYLLMYGFSGTPVSDVPQFLLWTSALILMANIISYNFYGWLLRFYSITFMTFAGFLCPIFGSFFGWCFLGEAITWHYFASLGLVTLGLFLFYRQELKRKS